MKKKKLTNSIVFFILLFISLNGEASEINLWDVLSKRPDTVITTKKDTAGNEVREAKLSSGVIYQENKDGSYSGIDNSGLGAINCAWMIFSETENLINTCYQDSHPNIKKAYHTAVERITDFIVQNNLIPITKSEVEESAKSMFAQSQKDMPKGKLCTSEFLPKGDKDLDDKGMKDFEATIDKLLSVPRPPVTNPCL